MLGDTDKALEDYTAAIERQSDGTPAYSMRGFIYYAQAQYAEALSDLDRAILLNPADPTVYLTRGKTYEALGRDQDALKDYSQALKLNDRLPEAYRGRGVIYSAFGNYELAMDDLNQAIRLDPSDGQAWLARGDLFFALHQFQKALNDYNEAIRMLPGSALAYNRGATFHCIKKLQEALDDYNRAIQIDPGFSYRLLQPGQRALRAGSASTRPWPTSSRRSLTPPTPMPFTIAASPTAEARHVRRAITDFTYVLHLDPNYAEAYYNRHLAYLQRGAPGDDRLRQGRHGPLPPPDRPGCALALTQPAGVGKSLNLERIGACCPAGPPAHAEEQF